MPKRPTSPRDVKGECTGSCTHRITGELDATHLSTSIAGRQNLTMRKSMRRFIRLTNGVSKKVGN